MPVIHREKGFRFHFYANEGHEPPHIHVSKAGAEGKWWLDELEQAYSYGFTPGERRIIDQIITAKRDDFLDEWHDFFAES